MKANLDKKNLSLELYHSKKSLNARNKLPPPPPALRYPSCSNCGSSDESYVSTVVINYKYHTCTYEKILPAL